MNKKTIITISTVLGLAIIAGGFLVLQKTGKQEVVKNNQKIEIVKNDENESKQKTENQEKDNQNNQEKVEELKVEDIDTSNWKTYRNEEYGFEVKYPEGWEVEEIKFAAIWPAPLPINCKKSPEKCPFDGVQFFSENSAAKTGITYFSVIISKNNELKTKNGWYVSKMEGSDFAPSDRCLLAYVKKINNQEKILISTSQEYKSECNRGQKDKLFKKIVDSVKVIK